MNATSVLLSIENLYIKGIIDFFENND